MMEPTLARVDVMPLPAVMIVGRDGAAVDTLAACAWQEGMRPLQAFTVPQALAAVRRERPLLALLEHGLAGEHPLALGVLSVDYRCPIALWIPAPGGRIANLYLAAPDRERFSAGLVARFVRRVLEGATGDRRAQPVKLGANRWVLHDQTFSVHRDGVQVSLTPSEFALFRALVSQPERVFSREELVRIIGGVNSARLGNAAKLRIVDVHVTRLRGKLSEDCIRTARGVGYAYQPRA